MKYPDDCIQYYTDNWWLNDGSKVVVRGSLVWVYAPFVDLVPQTIVPTGRVEATTHSTLKARLTALNPSQAHRKSTLPVAALPQLPKGEHRLVYRCKRRPALVLSTDWDTPSTDVAKSIPKSQRSRNIIVAPYYGVEADRKRAGWPDEYIRLIKACSIRQLMWDKLPLGGADSSILRLDHMFSVGDHYMGCEPSGHRLTDEALGYIDSWLSWFHTGRLREECELAFLMESLAEL